MTGGWWAENLDGDFTMTNIQKAKTMTTTKKGRVAEKLLETLGGL